MKVRKSCNVKTRVSDEQRDSFMPESKSSSVETEKKTVWPSVIGLVYGKDGKFKSSVPKGAVRPKPVPVPAKEK